MFLAKQSVTPLFALVSIRLRKATVVVINLSNSLFSKCLCTIIVPSDFSPVNRHFNLNIFDGHMVVGQVIHFSAFLFLTSNKAQSLSTSNLSMLLVDLQEIYLI